MDIPSSNTQRTLIPITHMYTGTWNESIYGPQQNHFSFLSIQSLGQTSLGCFYLFGCFLGVDQRTKAIHELHIWNSQIWVVASWSTENMGPRRGQSRIVHQGNWDQWAWTGKQSFAFNSWLHVAFYEASTNDSLTIWSVQWMNFYGAGKASSFNPTSCCSAR